MRYLISTVLALAATLTAMPATAQVAEPEFRNLQQCEGELRRYRHASERNGNPDMIALYNAAYCEFGVTGFVITFPF